MVRNAKTHFLQCFGYLSFTKDRIRLGSLQSLALALLKNLLLISCLTAVKSHLIRYYEKLYEKLRKYVLVN